MKELKRVLEGLLDSDFDISDNDIQIKSFLNKLNTLSEIFFSHRHRCGFVFIPEDLNNKGQQMFSPQMMYSFSIFNTYKLKEEKFVNE